MPSLPALLHWGRGTGSERAAVRSRRRENERLAERPCERAATERESRVRESRDPPWIRHPSNTGYEEPCVNLGGPSPKAKYSHATDSEPVP
jgi:hypothetical protein